MDLSTHGHLLFAVFSTRSSEARFERWRTDEAQRRGRLLFLQLSPHLLPRRRGVPQAPHGALQVRIYVRVTTTQLASRTTNDAP